MRYEFKVIAVWCAHLLTWPFGVSAWINHRWFDSERLFDFSAKALSLLPGKIGQYLRTSFYMQTLACCHYDLYIGFASFFSHPNACVGRGVKVGSFSIIGTATLEDHVIIGSRVSVLSGKYTHGGARGQVDPSSMHLEHVRVGTGTWLGEGVIVMANVGRHCIVSAGSVVARAIPDGVTAVGNPARFINFAGQKPAPAAPAAPQRSTNALAYTLAAILMGGLVMENSPSARAATLATDGVQEIVLVGASIGRAWNVAQLPDRLALEKVRFEYVGVPDSFDKGAAIRALALRARKPDAVIVKECAVYFPGPLADYRGKMVAWVDTLRAAGVTPILATSVPVGKDTRTFAPLRSWVSTQVLGRESRLAQLQAYNDWLRAYARAQGIALLDLEQALRADGDFYLRPEFDAGDRIHINQAAYRRLDSLIPGMLAHLDHMHALTADVRYAGLTAP